MGHYQNGEHGVNAPGDVALARYLPAGELDMIVGGHSQEPVCMEGPNLVKKTLSRVTNVSLIFKTALTLFKLTSGVNTSVVRIMNSVTVS